MWALFALASAGVFASVNIIDKRLLARHLPGVQVLYLWIAFEVSLLAVGLLGITGIPVGVSGYRVLVTFLSGLAIGGGLALLFVGLKQQEASRATALFQTYPVFVAVLAAVFLMEKLDLVQWLAIGLVAFGGLLISWQNLPTGPTDRGRPLFLHLPVSRGTPSLVGAALGQAVGLLGAKYALEEMSVWSVWALLSLGTALGLSIPVRPRHFWQLLAALRDRRTFPLLILGEAVLPNVGVGLILLATSLGSVSVVSAFAATRPLFVFIATIVLSRPPWRLLDESLERNILALKFTSIAIIIAGIVALSLR